MDLGILSTVISANPSLQSISLNNLLLFLSTAARLKNDILLGQLSDQPPSVPPEILPIAAQHFLSHACDLPLTTVPTCWSVFKDIIWNDAQVTSILCPPVSTFHDHGICHGFSMSFFTVFSLLHSPFPFLLASRSLYPPDQFCSSPGCPRTAKGMRMMHAEQRQAVLYTVANGPLPVHSVHLYCQGVSASQR